MDEIHATQGFPYGKVRRSDGPDWLTKIAKANAAIQASIPKKEDYKKIREAIYDSWITFYEWKEMDRCYLRFR